jgi:NADPH:quinone reductase-like Zn-dependent oxidoreductase
MKAIVIERFGPPTEVARLVERPDPPAPEAGQVALRVLRASINPADLLLISGRYGQLPTLPATPGAECVARVDAIGADVGNVAVGDVVVPMMASCWREKIVTKAAAVIRLPASVDLDQAAMLKANPATAALMLESIVPLGAGDWLIQNAANSAVGRYVARLARAAGQRSIAVVRRPELVDELKREGADAVIVHTGAGAVKLDEAARAASGGAPIKLALDAIGGAAAGALVECLADGGTLVNYGVLSGRPCEIDPMALIFRDIRARGFWLARWLREAPPSAGPALYARLAKLVADGTLRVPVAATYPFARIGEALAHAARDGRDGKILLSPG